MASTQDRFQTLGKNLIIIANLILNNQNLCKLLVVTNNEPLSAATIVDTDSLMNKNIRVFPKIPDEQTEKGSFITILMDEIVVNPQNEKVTIVNLKFDILCPINEWLVNEESLRPFLIMSELGSMFNELQLKGIGKMRFLGSEMIVMSDYYAGYSMNFNNHEFN